MKFRPGPMPRGPQLRDPEPFWGPVRFVPHGIECDFCRFPIAPGAPGRRVGERGTRAWFNSLLRVYECLGCREEAQRAEAARLAEQRPTGRAA